MVDEDDLDAAVAAGVLSAPQAAALRTFALQREQERVAASGPEERFRFMRGFNDFFFAIGIVLFVCGIAFFTIGVPAGSLAGAVVVWALAELLVARMRLVLPGILLACFFAAFVMAASPVDFWLTSPSQPPAFGALVDWFVSERQSNPSRSLMIPIALALFFYCIIGACAAVMFYLRFRLPFSLLLIAAFLVAAVLAATRYVWPEPARLIEALVVLLCGLLVFAAAMRFDMSDRERLSRLADCAFWLHLLASPLIVHSLITLVAPDFSNMSTPVAAAIFAIFASLTIIAVAIDRRALLVSGLTYVGVVIAYGITRATGTGTSERSFVVFATLIVLGSMVLVIGVGWLPLRRRLLATLPSGLAGRLPPVPARP